MQNHTKVVVKALLSASITALALNYSVIPGFSYFGIDFLKGTGWLGIAITVFISLIVGLIVGLVGIINLASKLTQDSAEQEDENKTIMSSHKKKIENIRRLWFSSHPSVIYVVGPESLTKTDFSTIESPNYVYLDRLGDKDSILEVMNLLSRLYPEAKIKKYMEKDFPRDLLDENIVVVGGPGNENDIGNEISMLFSKKVGTTVSYSDDFLSMVLKDGRKFQASHDEKDNVILDYGYFGRFQNPFNPKANVVLIHGIHTFGVLGSALAFNDHDKSYDNVKHISKNMGFNPHFEAIFETEIHNGVVVIPEVKEFFIHDDQQSTPPKEKKLVFSYIKNIFRPYEKT